MPKTVSTFGGEDQHSDSEIDMNKTEIDARLILKEDRAIDALKEEFEKYRPRHYEFLLTILGLGVVYFLYSYMTNFSNDLYQFFLAISVCSAANFRESLRINKRIDVAFKLIEKKLEKNA